MNIVANARGYDSSALKRIIPYLWVGEGLLTVIGIMSKRADMIGTYNEIVH